MEAGWIPKSLPVLAVRDAVHFPRLISAIHIVRESSVEVVRAGLEADRSVLALSQRDMEQDSPSQTDLYTIGTACRIQHAAPIPEGGYRGTFRGVARVRVLKFRKRRGVLWADVEVLEELPSSSLQVEATRRAVIEAFGRIVELHRHLPIEALAMVSRLESAGAVADAVAHHLDLPIHEKQAILEVTDEALRIELALKLLVREQSVLEAQQHIREQVANDLDRSQRELILREQLRVIQSELGDVDSGTQEAERYLDQIAKAELPEAVEAKAKQEAKRLVGIGGTSPESALARTYLDCLLEIPWQEPQEIIHELGHAKAVLDSDHFGLAEVKERVLDYLAVRKLSQSLRGPILCFVGPPGVGKTSVARTIARAIGRHLQVISLGGVRDEAEIRGHRRTYIGAMPGRLVQAIRQAGVRNPVLLLDEIDKLGGDFRGDPAGALLEALDPVQNRSFLDHYLDVPIDLSQAFFIATANRLDSVPPALRDRLEIVEFSSYSDEERLEIARRHLVPRNLMDHGLGSHLTSISEETLRKVALEYTMEPGVRDLDRQIATLCRKLARAVTDEDTDPLRVLDPETLYSTLGPSAVRRSPMPPVAEVGVVTGLVVGGAGGETIDVEALILTGENSPRIRTTGNLGSMLVESVETAVSFVRHCGLSVEGQVHVHVAQAAVPKDGPSAGLTLAIALYSATSGIAVPRQTAFTGEITLRGKVLGVGGIREKIAAAVRAGVTRVILPEANRVDFEALDLAMREQLEVVFVAEVRQAFEIVFGSEKLRP